VPGHGVRPAGAQLVALLDRGFHAPHEAEPNLAHSVSAVAASRIARPIRAAVQIGQIWLAVPRVNRVSSRRHRLFSGLRLGVRHLTLDRHENMRPVTLVGI
jgi:hypothetical protein